MKDSLYFNNSEDYLSIAQCSNTYFVRIGLDVGVYFVQRSSITRPSTVNATKKKGRCRLGKLGRVVSTMQGVDEGTWWIGRIQKNAKASWWHILENLEATC